VILHREARDRRSRRLVAAAIALGAAACGGAHEPARPESARAVEVRTAVAAASSVPSIFEASGTVRARTTAVVASRILAPVSALRVEPGDRVRRGDLLVQLDDRELEAGRQRAQAAVIAAERGVAVAAAQAKSAASALDLAAATHTRISTLRGRNSATPQELDQAVAALRGAQAQVDAAASGQAQASASLELARASASGSRIAASYARVTAPFEGTITETLVEQGNLVSPGTPLVRIEDTSGLRADVTVDESRAASISIGQEVEVLVGSATGPLEGRVYEIVRAVDPATRNFVVKVALAGAPPLRSGAFARVRFAGPARTAVTVPAGALVRRGQLTMVFVVEAGDRAHLRMVDVAPAPGGLLEVRAGIAAGDRVVVDPPAPLEDGMPVRAGSAAAAARGEPR
jgi:RND family efflux transporter MFP subunit